MQEDGWWPKRDPLGVFRSFRLDVFTGGFKSQTRGADSTAKLCL
jgi:hypothetical protein